MEQSKYSKDAISACETPYDAVKVELNFYIERLIQDEDYEIFEFTLTDDIVDDFILWLTDSTDSMMVFILIDQFNPDTNPMIEHEISNLIFEFLQFYGLAFYTTKWNQS